MSNGKNECVGESTRGRAFTLCVNASEQLASKLRFKGETKKGSPDDGRKEPSI